MLPGTPWRAVLPTRDAVVLPGAVTELQIGRPASVAAVRHAAGTQAPVLVLLQRDPLEETPGPGALFEVGTLCRVVDAERVSAASAVVGVLGLGRVRAREFQHSGDALLAQADGLSWAPPVPTLPEPLRFSLAALVTHGLGAVLSARSFAALEPKTAVEQLAALSVIAPLDAAALQRVLELEALQPVADALDSLRDRSWLARFLRWARRR